jgi:endoglucanase
LLGTWSNSPSRTYSVYALDFSVGAGTGHTITVSGPAPAISPVFPVGTPAVLYPGLLLNTRFFYETERDGPNYIPNALRTAPGYLNDAHATVFETPPHNDAITTTGPPLAATGAVMDASGGWWDAGDYMKYVETTSYTVALQEIGIRDFPGQMGPMRPCVRPPHPTPFAGNVAGSPFAGRRPPLASISS